MEVKKIVEEWEIWNKEEEAAKLQEKAKKLVSSRFYKQIHVFGKKASKRMPTKKVWDHMMKVEKGFMLRKGKVYLFSREERGELHELIEEQLKKEYIRLLKLSQMVPVFFCREKEQ